MEGEGERAMLCRIMVRDSAKASRRLEELHLAVVYFSPIS